MKKYCFLAFATYLLSLAPLSIAAPLIEISPSSTQAIIISPTGSSYLSYSAKNNSLIKVSDLTIDPNYGNNNKAITLKVAANQCTSLKPGEHCNFVISAQGLGKASQLLLSPKLCVFKGASCSVPEATQRVRLSSNPKLTSSQFPRPYAGSFYPIYNSGPGQWLPPDQNPLPPFERVSAIFVAFAHAYPEKNGAILNFEKGQTAEPERLALLVKTVRTANPQSKLLISLGWGHKDWDAIDKDYRNHANLFVPSVIEFIRHNQLDGFDIDDESIGDESGSIPQSHFDGLIGNLRNALNAASLQDGKPYYLTITPAGNNEEPGGIEQTQVDSVNAHSFDLINIQTYYSEDIWAPNFFKALLALGYPKLQIANGIDVEKTNCNPSLPPYLGLAGLFNWDMTKDSVCGTYTYTQAIANLVGYYGGI